MKKRLIFNDLKAYQRSDHSIWTDDYISQNMLSAHLDLSNDVASRNINTIEKTIEWILDKTPQGKVLDLGCGPGLYASLLAKKGYSVTGIDISERSISYAKKKQLKKISGSTINVKIISKTISARDMIWRSVFIATSAL